MNVGHGALLVILFDLVEAFSLNHTRPAIGFVSPSDSKKALLGAFFFEKQESRRPPVNMRRDRFGSPIVFQYRWRPISAAF
jgi:hypothetical protein